MPQGIKAVEGSAGQILAGRLGVGVVFRPCALNWLSTFFAESQNLKSCFITVIMVFKPCKIYKQIHGTCANIAATLHAFVCFFCLYYFFSAWHIF